MARYLVVANQTLAGSALIPLIADRAARDAATVHVVVPATDPAHESPPALGAAAERAQDRLDKALESLANAGVQATGEVGVADPIQAIRNALKAGSFTELMISTFPPGFSRWLHADLPHRGCAVRDTRRVDPGPDRGSRSTRRHTHRGAAEHQAVNLG